MTQATPKDYWISPQAIYIELNALGIPDYIQASCISGAQILVYVKGVIDFDSGHNYRRWTLQAMPTVFNSHTEKYVYVAIPRDDNSDQSATIVFPSEEIDIYGVNASGEQVGLTDYYYIYLQGVISSSGDNGTDNRDWVNDHRIVTGTLASDEAIAAQPSESEWYQYSSVDGIVTFLKNLTMKAGTFFRELYAKHLTVKQGGSVTFENQGELNGPTHTDTPVTSEDRYVTPKYMDDNALSSKNADTANGHITFDDGLTSNGDADINGNLQVKKSADIGQDINVHGDASIGGNLNVQGDTFLKDLTVTGSAHFFELIIDKIKAAGGTYIFSAANSFNVDRVATGDNVIRLYWLAENGGNGSMNTWEVGDQAISMDFNRAKVGETFSANNKYWWALVTATSGNTPETITEDGVEHLYHWIEVSTTEKADGCTVEAEVGDAIAQWGSRSDDKKRQAAQMIAAYKSPDTGVEAPCWVQYVGINSFTITEDNRLNRVAYNGNVFKGSFVATSEGEQGRDLLEWLESLQHDTDAHFDIWYGQGVPTLENEPAASWTTDNQKAEHVDDLYFDRSDTAKSDGGHCYRFISTTKGGTTTYAWEDYTDHDTLKALTKAQNIADDGIITAGMEKAQLLITRKNMESEFASFSEPTDASTDGYKLAYGFYKVAYDNFMTATADIVSEANLNKDTKLEDIGLSSAQYVDLYYNYYSLLAKVREASEASIKASISTIGGKVELAVTKNGLKTAGMTVEDEHITLDAKKTTFTGDLTVQGAITDSTSYVGMDGSLWSPNEVGELEKSANNLLVPDGNGLFVPIDMATIKSVQVQTTDPSLVTDTQATPSTALVTLPMYDAVNLGCGVTMPAYRRSGTHVLLRNAFSLAYNQWSNSSQWDDKTVRMSVARSCVYVCTDPRLLALTNYTDDGEVIAVDGRDANGKFATADWFKGCMYLNGRRGRWLCLLPGQQVELVSTIAMWQQGTNTPVPYLTWYVVGGDSLSWLEKKMTVNANGYSASGVFNAAVTGGESMGVGSSDKYSDAFFGYPKLSDTASLSEKVVVTLSPDSKPYITIE